MAGSCIRRLGKILIDVKMPIFEIKGNVETRYSWQQPFPGSLFSASLVERAWERVWVSKCKTLFGVFAGVLLSFSCTVGWTGTRVMIVDDYRTIIWYQIKKIKSYLPEMCQLIIAFLSGQTFFFASECLHRHLRDGLFSRTLILLSPFLFSSEWYPVFICYSRNLLVFSIFLRLVSCASPELAVMFVIYNKCLFELGLLSDRFVTILCTVGLIRQKKYSRR